MGHKIPFDEAAFDLMFDILRNDGVATPLAHRMAIALVEAIKTANPAPGDVTAELIKSSARAFTMLYNNYQGWRQLELE